MHQAQLHAENFKGVSFCLSFGEFPPGMCVISPCSCWATMRWKSSHGGICSLSSGCDLMFSSCCKETSNQSEKIKEQDNTLPTSPAQLNAMQMSSRASSGVMTLGNTHVAAAN